MELPSDGYHIGLLIMAAIQKLCPQFLQEGRLCWLRSPLYIVTNGKKESYYFNDEELYEDRYRIVNHMILGSEDLVDYLNVQIAKADGLYKNDSFLYKLETM